MTLVLKVGEKEYNTEDIISLLNKYRLIPQIAREIIIDQAVAKIEVTEDQLKQSRLQFYQTHQIANPEQLTGWLKQQKMTTEQLEHLLLRDLQIERYKQQTWANQVESYFLQYKEKYDRIVYSLIRVKDIGLAKELYFRIAEEENTFAELAKDYSQGGESGTGGLIGPVELTTPHPNIAQILRHSQEGQLWPPITVGDWIVIVRLEQYISAQLDDATRSRLLNELFQNWLIEESNKVVNYLTPLKQEL